MKTEATLLREIAAATTLREQANLVQQLDHVRASKAAQVQQDRDLDFTSAVIDQTLSPVLTHSMHTASTDWLDEVASPPLDTNRVIAEAAIWFGKTSSMVREDAEEFAEQARGQARRVAGAYGEQAGEAERAYLDYVSFLHRREGASGLPQIQQLIDGNNQSARTPLPEDVFDTFEQPVDPMNVGVDEMQSSYNAPLMNEIIQNGQGMGQPEQPNMHGMGTGPSQNPYGGSGMPVGASLVDAISPAISHAYNLDEFREAQRREAALRTQAVQTIPMSKAESDRVSQLMDADDRERGKCMNCTNGNHTGTNGTPGCRGKGCTCDARGCGKVRNMKSSSVEAASGLPQVQQVVDSFENPDPKPLPQDVMFPLIPYFQGEQNTGGGDSAMDPRMSSKGSPASRLPFVVADQFGTSSEQAMTVGSENPEMGKTHDKTVKQAEAPSNAMEKATASKDFERAYVFARAWKPGQRIVSKGSVEFEAGLYAGMAENEPVAQQAWLDSHTKWAAKDAYLGTRIEVHAAYTQVLKKEAGSFSGYEPGHYSPHWDGPTHPTAWSPQAYVSPNEGLHCPECAEQKWGGNDKSPHREPEPGPTQDNHGDYLGYYHPRQDITGGDGDDGSPATCRGCGKTLDESKIGGKWASKTAASTTDLETMEPGLNNAHPDGTTPLNGPGTVPPMAGGMDPARPGGAAPYNGAAPFSAPVAPDPGWKKPGAHMSATQRQAAFRATVAAAFPRPQWEDMSLDEQRKHLMHGHGLNADGSQRNLDGNHARAHLDGWVHSPGGEPVVHGHVHQDMQAEGAAEPKNTPVCRGCGEAFESKSVAHEAHGKNGCGTETGERGYEMKRESEAW